ATRRAGTRRLTGNRNLLLLFQPLRHPLESHLPVGMLRPPLGSRHHGSTRAMQQPHPSLDFIAVLTSRPAGDEELHIAITFQRFSVSRISLLSHQKLLIIRLKALARLALSHRKSQRQQVFHSATT